MRERTTQTNDIFQHTPSHKRIHTHMSPYTLDHDLRPTHTLICPLRHSAKLSQTKQKHTNTYWKISLVWVEMLNRFPMKTPLLYYNITDLYVSSDVSCGCVILAKNSMKYRSDGWRRFILRNRPRAHTTRYDREREEILGGMVHSVVCLLVGLVFTGRDVSSMLLAPFSHHS